MTTKRTDRVISVSGETFDRLTAVQEQLAIRNGFKPTIKQVIDHLLSLPDPWGADAGEPGGWIIRRAS